MGASLLMNQEDKYIYNNEAIATYSILCILEKSESISVAKLSLVLPFLLNNRILQLLTSRKKIRSIEELVLKSNGELSSYSDSYEEYLPLCINALTVLQSAQQAMLNDGIVTLIQENYVPFHDEKIGTRALRISKATKKLILLLNDKEENLFLQLRVKI